KPAASAFLAFLGSEEANRIQAEAGAANPAFVGTNDAYVDAIPEFSLDVFVDAAETAQPYPASQNTSAWLQLEELLFPKILGGHAPLEREARELADRMNGVLADETCPRACRPAQATQPRRALAGRLPRPAHDRGGRLLLLAHPGDLPQHLRELRPLRRAQL